MAKKRWLERELLAVLPTDRPDWTWRVYRIKWLDESECVQFMKYAVQSRTSKHGKAYTVDCPYKPIQMGQVPVTGWDNFVLSLPLLDPDWNRVQEETRRKALALGGVRIH